ncbi:hypothetical protein GPJ56_010328 [Histomonas meleagridis]|uniref:uncharacterized protein n=1 Tax=Histomonas meleagridis TaxID=135588 RepID=UPI003559C826|nr:hypothetical protein GPJ56_010328 [Histomonas meleagridis]KAH0797935.1 hypothetical protein GO595_009564 [Histomonas meleagridis]
MNFDFDLALDYFCNETNFKVCRLFDRIENNGCPVGIYDVTDTYMMADIPFLILGIIIAVFFMALIGLLKKDELQFKHQVPTRGLFLWRSHIFAVGLSILMWTLSISFFPMDGPVEQFFIAARAACFDIAGALLIIITLVDTHLLPWDMLWVNFIELAVSLVIGLIYFVNLTNPSPSFAVFMGFIFPVACQLFLFIGMIPVLIYRRLWMGLVYLVLLSIFGIAPYFIELYANGGMCEGTAGWFTAPSLCVIIYAFYRVFIQLYFVILKADEKMDGLPPNPRRYDDVSSSELNKPLPIEVSDYTYSYTYTESEAEQEQL